RLYTDGANGETVAVVLDGLATEKLEPQLAVSSPITDLSDGTLEFGPDTARELVTPIEIVNPGAVALDIDTLEATGGFVLRDAPQGSFTLLPGESRTVYIAVVDPAAGSSGLLRIVSNDPAQSPYELSLLARGTLADDGDSAYTDTGTWSRGGLT